MADEISKGVLTNFQEQTTQLQINAVALSKTLDDLLQKQHEMTGSWQKYPPHNLLI